MNKSFPVQIYPSQLQSFKEKTNELAEAIAEALNQKKLSAFKRNDYVSIGIGYKSHDDLIDWANSRKQADKGQPLLLFADPLICNSINEVLCNKIEALTTETCSLILSSLGQKELGRKIISDIKTNVAPLFSDKYLHEGSPTLKRLNSYFSVLAGLKMQSGVAALGLTNKDLKVDRSEVGNAQQLMSNNIKAVNHIVEIVRELNTTVPDLNEQQLKAWLIENDIHFSHLSNNPSYYACCKQVEGKDYYFITQYYEDGEGCAGHSKSIKEATDITLSSAFPDENLIVVDPTEDKVLLSTLAYPELCSDIYLAEKPAALYIDEANTRSPHEVPSELNKMMERIKEEGRHNDIELMNLRPDDLWMDEKAIKEHSLHIGQKTNNLAFEVNLDESPKAPIIPDATLADMIHMIESCWPEGATCATQEADGEILYWSADVQDVLKARQIANTDDGLMPHIGFKYQVHANYYEIDEQAYVASNWKTSVVTPLDINF